MRFDAKLTSATCVYNPSGVHSDFLFVFTSEMFELAIHISRSGELVGSFRASQGLRKLRPLCGGVMSQDIGREPGLWHRKETCRRQMSMMRKR